MISLEDCFTLSGLTEDEVLAIAEHEHLPALHVGDWKKARGIKTYSNATWGFALKMPADFSVYPPNATPNRDETGAPTGQAIVLQNKSGAAVQIEITPDSREVSSPILTATDCTVLRSLKCRGHPIELSYFPHTSRSVLPARDLSELESAFRAIVQDRCDALVVFPDSAASSQRRRSMMVVPGREEGHVRDETWPFHCACRVSFERRRTILVVALALLGGGRRDSLAFYSFARSRSAIRAGTESSSCSAARISEFYRCSQHRLGGQRPRAQKRGIISPSHE